MCIRDRGVIDPEGDTKKKKVVKVASKPNETVSSVIEPEKVESDVPDTESANSE